MSEQVLVIGMGSAGRRAAQQVLTTGSGVLWVDPNHDQVFPEGTRVSSIEQGLEQSPVLAILATPPAERVTPIALCLAAKVPCLIEKPLAVSVSAGRVIWAALRTAGVWATVGYQLRLDPTVQRIVGDGSPPYHASIWDEQDMRAWPRASYDRDVLLEYSHELDLARYWMGRALTVLCRRIGAELYLLSLTTHYGTVSVRLNAALRSAEPGVGPLYLRGAELSQPVGRSGWVFDAKTNADCYRNAVVCALRQYPICPVDEALDTLCVIEAARRSMVSGEWEEVACITS